MTKQDYEWERLNHDALLWIYGDLDKKGRAHLLKTTDDVRIVIEIKKGHRKVYITYPPDVSEYEAKT